MFKYLLLIIALFLIVLPTSAIDITTCPTCPPPQFVYVTVTPLTTPAPQIVYVNVPAEQVVQQGLVINDAQIQIIKYGMIAIAIILILAVLAKLIIRKRSQKIKQSKKLIISSNIDELYEETPEYDEEPEPIPEPFPKPEPERKRIKKPKKIKSLLDQDFEF